MIINSQDIRKIRPIAENVNDTKRIDPYIEECEKLFLMPAIGAATYKLLDGETKPDYFDALMDGGYYENDTKHFSGLREAMGYLVYSRFSRNQNVNATAFGIVTKNGQFSDAADEKTIVRISNDAEKIGLEYLRQCVDFLNFGKSESDKQIYKVKSKYKIIGR